jgi:hypothetical protein
MRCTQFLLLVAALLLSISLSACGGKARVAMRPSTSNPQTAPAADEPAAGPRSTLRLSVPALANLKPGAEFSVELSAEMVEPLFQACARVLYDPAQLEPVSAERGSGLPGDGVFVCATDKPLELADIQGRPTDKAVPFAFTRLPGQTPLAAGDSKLVTLRFRVRQPITGDAGLRLLNDPRYLQLRSADGRRLPFDLVNEAGAR